MKSSFNAPSPAPSRRWFRRDCWRHRDWPAPGGPWCWPKLLVCGAFLFGAGIPAIAPVFATPLPGTGIELVQAPADSPSPLDPGQDAGPTPNMAQNAGADLEPSAALRQMIQTEVDQALAPQLALMRLMLTLALLMPALAILVVSMMGRKRLEASLIASTRDQLLNELRPELDRARAALLVETKQQQQELLDLARRDVDRLRQALAEQETQIQDRDSEPEAWYARGNEFDALQRYEEAIAAYEKAIRLEPSFFAAWVNRGYVLDRIGRYEAAIASFDHALRLKPDYPGIWYNRGTVLGKLQRHAEAVQAFNRTIRLKPNSTEAWNNRGTSLAKLHRYDEAIASFDRAISLANEFAGAWYGKAACLAAQGKVELAIEHLHHAIQLDPNTYRDLARTDPEFDSVRNSDLFRWLMSTDA